MSAFIELQLPSGERTTVGPGAIIGRSFAADVQLEDGRVSEAHALISLRGSELVLFALRGRVRVEGRDVPRVTLIEGLRVELARGVELSVTRLQLPDEVLAVEGDGVPRQVLTSVVSVCTAPQLHLVQGVRAEAEALIFSDGLSWFLRRGASAPKRLRPGERTNFGGIELRFVALALTGVATPETGPATTQGMLRLVSQHASVQVWTSGAPTPCVVSGQPALVLSTLLSQGKPVRWEALAATLWQGEEPDEVVRHRLDVVLGKLRKRLDDAGVRRDLVTAHHNGFLELVLYPGDQAHDRG